MSKNGTPEHAKRALEGAIAAIDEALAAGTSIYPEEGPRFRSELLQFRNNLQRMFADVVSEQNASSADGRRVAPLGFIIGDQWPVDLALGDIILRAEQEYDAFVRVRGRVAKGENVRRDT